MPQNEAAAMTEAVMRIEICRASDIAMTSCWAWQSTVMHRSAVDESESTPLAMGPTGAASSAVARDGGFAASPRYVLDGPQAIRPKSLSSSRNTTLIKSRHRQWETCTCQKTECGSFAPSSFPTCISARAVPGPSPARLPAVPRCRGDLSRRRYRRRLAVAIELVLAAAAQRRRPEAAAQGAQGCAPGLCARQSRRVPARLLRHPFRRHRGVRARHPRGRRTAAATSSSTAIISTSW